MCFDDDIQKKKKSNLPAADGAITLFLSLVLLIVVSLICTVAESTRVYLAMVHAKSQAYRAVETEFAGYARQLFDDYGIVAMYEENNVDERIQSNIEFENTSEEEHSDFIRSVMEGVARTEGRYLTDNGGEAFVNQVLEYEKYEASEEMVNCIISRYQKYKNNENDSGTQEEYEHIDDYESVSEKVSQDYLDAVEEVIDIDFNSPEGNAQDKLAFFVNNKSIVEEAIEACDGYIEERDKMQEKYGKSSSSLFEDENRKSLKNIILQIEIIEAKYTELVEDVVSNEGTDEEIELGRQLFLAEVSNGESLILSAQSELVVADTENAEDGKSKGIFETAKKLIEDGALALVIPDDMEISSKTVKKDKLPTTVCEDMKDNDSLKDLRNRAWYISYINNNFGNLLSNKDNTALRYEMEYIVGGKDNDKTNLEIVLGELLLIRQISNNITLVSDSVKMECLTVTASTISWSICMPYLEPLIELILIEAWALAESVVDIRTLLAGGEVSLVKSQAEWKTSLENMLTEVTCKNVDKEKDGKLIKQNYNMYLVILLLTKETKNLTYRVMDLIQMNICMRYNSSFEMKKCMVSAEYDISFRIPTLFLSLPFLNKTDENGGYEITVRTGYSYQ